MEGDFVESLEGLIFDVKGLIHPPDRVIAYLRYYPDEDGDRVRAGVRYRKVYPLGERRNLLRERWPLYLYHDKVFHRELQGVPIHRIARIYRPRERVEALREKGELDTLEEAALSLIDTLREATGLPYRCFGVSGSILVGLQTPTSDIDPIIYGEKASFKVYEALKDLLAKGGELQPYGEEGLRSLYRARAMEESLDYETFKRLERRKVLEGLYKGYDYYIRCVKEEVKERYGDKEYFPLGECRVEATITDDRERIFTPCQYMVERVTLLEGVREGLPERIVSYRGRFSEQALQGERVRARGILEKVLGREGEYYQLVIGESPYHHLIVL